MKKSKITPIGIAFILIGVLVIFIVIFYAPKSDVAALSDRIDQLDTVLTDYASKSDVAALSAQIDSSLTDMEGYYAKADLAIESVENRVTSVKAKNDTLQVLVKRNEDSIAKHYKELRGLAETHGRKINDVIELAFKASYGADWDKEGKKVFDQYVRCGNQNLWDQMVKKLTPEQVRKILKVHDINERIAKLEKKKTS